MIMHVGPRLGPINTSVTFYQSYYRSIDAVVAEKLSIDIKRTYKFLHVELYY